MNTLSKIYVDNDITDEEFKELKKMYPKAEIIFEEKEDDEYEF